MHLDFFWNETLLQMALSLINDSYNWSSQLLLTLLYFIKMCRNFEVNCPYIFFYLFDFQSNNSFAIAKLLKLYANYVRWNSNVWNYSCGIEFNVTLVITNVNTIFRTCLLVLHKHIPVILARWFIFSSLVLFLLVLLITLIYIRRIRDLQCRFVHSNASH